MTLPFTILDVLVGELLVGELHHAVLELCLSDETVPFAIEHPQGLFKTSFF